VKLGLSYHENTDCGVFENRVLRRIFGPKRKWQEAGDCIMRSFITCTLHQVLLK
jgi:hypothetical protein